MQGRLVTLTMGKIRTGTILCDPWTLTLTAPVKCLSSNDLWHIFGSEICQKQKQSRAYGHKKPEEHHQDGSCGKHLAPAICHCCRGRTQTSKLRESMCAPYRSISKPPNPKRTRNPFQNSNQEKNDKTHTHTEVTIFLYKFSFLLISLFGVLEGRILSLHSSVCGTHDRKVS